MTSEEIKTLLAASEKTLRLETLAVPATSWIVSLSALWLATYFFSLEGLFFSLFLLLLSLILSVSNRMQWREMEHRRAILIWERIAATTFGYRVSALTTILIRDITTLYQADPRGEILPLSQAIRLVHTHHQQQQRLEGVLSRLQKLRSIGASLREKTEQLRGLGEEHRQGEVRLQSLRDDEAALDALSQGIKASCHRLELIALEAHKNQQMRQLHREISALTAQKPSDQITQLASGSLLDIERGITREIETFLQLERETDRRLREI